MTGRRYDTARIRKMLREPRHIETVVRDLYGGDAVFEKSALCVGDVAGGAGRSCRFETLGRDAGRFRDVKPQGTKPHGDLIDAVQAVRGCSTAEAIQYLGDLLGASPKLAVVAPTRAAPTTTSGDDLAPISAETLRKHRRRLVPETAAWTYLEERGLEPDLLKERFGVGVAGLSGEREKRRGYWLTAPVIGSDGTLWRRMMKLTIPGASVNPLDPDAWCPGRPATTWSGAAVGKGWLFVVGGIKDLWRVWTAIRGTSLEVRIAIIASTHGSSMPDEWRDANFWLPWDRVYLAQPNDDVGEATASQIRGFARRDFLRVEVPRSTGKDWMDFFQAGYGVADFEKLLDQAFVIGAPRAEAAPPVPLEQQEDGVYEDRRININGAFINGHMYYPFQVRRVQTVQRRRQLPDGAYVMVDQKVSHYETQVVRSDGAVLGISAAPTPAGVRDEDRVLILDDGTEISNVPQPQNYSTWRWPSISRFVDDVAAGRPPHRPLQVILAEVVAYLRQLIWLPHETDYHLLASYVAMSHCYDAFDAIPLLLINGDKGSGKSTLAQGLADLAFNGQVLGGGSEKAFIRFVDQGRGLLVLDDLERVGQRGPDDGGYGDINQVLKVSYSKATGLKSVVEKSGATRLLNFYGPKVVTNISGIDAVNATRMYTIFCRPMPEAVKTSGRIRGRDLAATEPLRQELHAWGMANVAAVHELYRGQLRPQGTRVDEIAAPLRAIAELADDAEFEAAVNSAINRLSDSKGEDQSAQDLLLRAVGAAVERGAREVISLAQIQAELALIPEARTLDGPDTMPPDLHPLQDPASIGRLLNTLGVRTAAPSTRARLNGEIVRCYELEPEYVARVLERASQEGRAAAEPYRSSDPKRLGLAFCDGTPCRQCPYRTVCEAALPNVAAGKDPALWR